MLFIGWSLLEGIGGALMIPATLSIVSGTYTNKNRTLALAIVSGMAGIAAAIGPLFGGVLTTYVSWRYGFAIELIIIFVIFIFNKKIMGTNPILKKSDFDVIGSIFSVGGFILFISGILSLNSFNLQYTLTLLLSSFILLILFGLYEIKRVKNNKEPILNIYLLKTVNLSIGTIIRLLSSLVLAGIVFSVTIFLQLVLKTDAFTTGLALMPLTIGLLVFSLFAPKLSLKIKSHKKVLILGLLVAIIGCFLLKYKFGLNTKIQDIVVGMFLIGGGLGFVLSLGTDLALIGTNSNDESSASGLITTGNMLGSSMGTAIIGVLLIVGAIGGLHQGINMYTTHVIDDGEFNSNLHNYIEKMGHLNLDDLKGENSEII